MSRIRPHENLVSVGTATVALVLNGLGWSNRQLYLVPQFFADKPVEHLLGPGIRAEELNDDCLGRTLDWLYAHNVTTLFAGLALRARKAFGVTTDRLHADTTSFSVHGQYARSPAQAAGHETPSEEAGGEGEHNLPAHAHQAKTRREEAPRGMIEYPSVSSQEPSHVDSNTSE